MQVNRKWGLFAFNMPRRLVSLHCTYRDDLTEDFGKTTAQECKKSTSGCPASLKNAFG